MNFPGRPQSFFLSCAMQSSGQVCWQLISFTAGFGQPPTQALPYAPIKEAIAGVCNAITGLNTVIAPASGYTPNEIRSTVQKLREAGRNLSTAFFGGDINKIAMALPRGQTGIAYASPPKQFGHDWPLEFCVFTDPSDGKDYFFGDRCVVVRVPTTENEFYPAGLSEQTGTSKRGPRLAAFAEDDGLASACETYAEPSLGREEVEEVNALLKVVAGKDQITFLRPLNEPMSSDERLGFQDWLTRPVDIVHFNSHTELDKPSKTRKLRVRRGARIGLADLNFENSSFVEQTLVVLNACESAFGEYDVDGSLAAKFLERDATAVACTTGPVDDALATEFANEFYAAMAAPNSVVWKAILTARHAISQRRQHPLANLFTMLGATDFALRIPDAS